MIRSTLLALALGVSALGLSACGDNTNTGAAGTAHLAEQTDPNTYVSARYGITVVAPADWFVMDSAVTKKMMDAGRDTALANADAQEKAAVAASLERNQNIFGFLEFDPSKASENGAGIMALAEDVSSAPEVTNGREYFVHLRSVFEQTGTNVSIADTTGATQIDGRPFDRMDIVMHGTSPAGTPLEVKQRYIAAKHNNDMIVFIQSWVDEADLATLDKTLASIKLDWK